MGRKGWGEIRAEEAGNRVGGILGVEVRAELRLEYGRKKGFDVADVSSASCVLV